jgi:GMP reductase
MSKYLKYSDVNLVPNFSIVRSRSDCDVSKEIGGKKFKLPVIPSNMKSVIDVRHCKWMSDNDYFYIMHRFDVDIQKFIEEANEENWKTVSISLGVKGADKDIIKRIRNSKSRVDYITIDIAHGHCESMKEMIEICKSSLENVCIIAGNVAKPEAVADLSAWGADYVKVGIGQGSPCTTKDKTGFTIPMFTCVESCSKVLFDKDDGFMFSNASLKDDYKLPEKVKIIADGGVCCNGDAAKALVAGADLVMAGGLFACCSDSPSHSIEIDGMLHKAYYGSASFENKKTRTHVEGALRNIPSCGMNFKTKLIEIDEDLKSAVSYSGGKNLLSLQDVKYIKV